MSFENSISRSAAIDCALCADAPCESACPAKTPAKAVRSIRFGNSRYAAAVLPQENPCAGCSAPCEKACVRAGRVPIRALMDKLYDEVRPGLELPAPSDKNRLKTDLCGVPLENPFLLSSSVVASTYDMCARAFEAGWAGAGECQTRTDCEEFPFLLR